MNSQKRKEIKLFIQNNYETMSDKCIADHFGIGVKTVGNMRYKLGIKRFTNNLNFKLKKVITLLCNDHTNNEIAIMYNTTESNVRQFLRNYKIVRTEPHTRIVKERKNIENKNKRIEELQNFLHENRLKDPTYKIRNAEFELKDLLDRRQ